MKNFKQEFYEKSYKKELKLRSSYGWLYQLFKNYETHREDSVFSLISKGSRMLDVGCGNGRLIFRSLDKFDMLVGIDINTQGLKEAKKILSHCPQITRKKVKFLHYDADLKLPFMANYFDTVTLVAVLEHLFDPVNLAAELKRILKKSGELIIQVPNLGFLPRRIAVLLGNLPVTSEDETGWDGGHLHYFTIKSIVNLLENKGFSIDKITCSGIFANLRSWWVSLLGADIIIKAKKK